MLVCDPLCCTVCALSWCISLAGSYTNDLVGDGGGGLFIDNSGGSVGNGTVILENITAADNNGAGSRAKAIGPG